MTNEMKTPYALFGCECGEGWDSLVAPVLQQAMADGAEIFQIKEKFGGLRIYARGGSEHLHQLIEEAEQKSFQTCEQCGVTENVTTGTTPLRRAWVKTLCDDCNENWGKALYDKLRELNTPYETELNRYFDEQEETKHG